MDGRTGAHRGISAGGVAGVFAAGAIAIGLAAGDGHAAAHTAAGGPSLGLDEQARLIKRAEMLAGEIQAIARHDEDGDGRLSRTELAGFLGSDDLETALPRALMASDLVNGSAAYGGAIAELNGLIAIAAGEPATANEWLVDRCAAGRIPQRPFALTMAGVIDLLPEDLVSVDGCDPCDLIVPGGRYGRAWVYPDGFLNTPALEEVCLSHLGVYDAETGERIASADGEVRGKYLRTSITSLNDFDGDAYYPPVWDDFREFDRPSNDYRIDPNCWDDPAMGPPCNLPDEDQRKSVLWGAQVHSYYYITQYREEVMNEAFVNALPWPQWAKDNVLVRQMRPDIEVPGEEEYEQALTQIEVLESFPGSAYAQLFPSTNLLTMNSLSRNANYSDDFVDLAQQERMGLHFDPDENIVEYANFVYAWIMQDTRGPSGDAWFGQFPSWQINVTPVLNDMIGTFEAARRRGTSMVKSQAWYTARQMYVSTENGEWQQGYPCWDEATQTGDPTFIDCDHGEDLDNCAMFDPDATHRQIRDGRGVFPFRQPAGEAFDNGPPAGPLEGNLASQHLGGFFYDVAFKAGLGWTKAAQLMWQSAHLIDDAWHNAPGDDGDAVDMDGYGERIHQAAIDLWGPGNEYLPHISEMMTGRGMLVPQLGGTTFRDQFIEPAIPADTSMALEDWAYTGQWEFTTGPGEAEMTSGQPAAQYYFDRNGASGIYKGYAPYGLYSFNRQEAVTANDPAVEYVAYQFDRNSRYGPCDYLDLYIPGPDLAYENGRPGDGGEKLTHETPERTFTEETDLGNRIVLVPSYIVQAGDALLNEYPEISAGDAINLLRVVDVRLRCPNENEGPYFEDVEPFGYRIIRATPNGFSFEVQQVVELNDLAVYALTIVDPSRSFAGESDYLWEYENTGDEFEMSGTLGGDEAFTLIARKNEALTLRITRLRDGEEIEIRDRANDLDRSGGRQFVTDFYSGR